ncbi:L-glutamate gamma-semialdehyde dehydrogenase [candidate division WOR-3 bacterium]|uniref:L-glutamate gamma-semialdehyde dehydrogenase n=1 Tax=candidate division WOR-3 bacterium TaxID=2052148 RepID=A0A660SNN7_UNCW3|nr:MAG: L-glutamate gamma-semialdehyde dehydrogenase [candidate division WOR-3 bacterium]
MRPEFKNESYTDFTNPENRKAMEEAIARIEAEAGKEYDLIIDGKRVKAKERFNSYNPSEKDQVLGVFQKADGDLAEKALETALRRFEEWRFEKPETRAEYLFKAADIMRKRRLELAATMVLEVGKSWPEADADVAEAIDFLEFYGREAIRYGGKQPVTPYPGEQPELIYIPLGVGIVIPPWNFPLAILCGMTSASVVTGNTVVLKPSSDSPLIAYKFMEVMEEAGLPDGVINYLTGPGRIAGETLVAHPKTRFIAFTGSMAVGLRIVELAAKTQPGQIWIKRVIAEMGGKDFIIVDSEADLDAAVKGVLVSAYGYQGQKCSACSRAIILADIYDEFLSRFIPEVEKITVGPVKDHKNFMGPVINEAAYRSILEYIEIGKKEGRLLCGGGPAEGNGWFIQPTVFADVDTKARIAQEEIFGPVLAVIKANDYDQAIEIANDTIYGLTGSVYTRNREKIEKAKRLAHVGNLYINRKCTGALVGVHPFGGFNMSGTDSKAGGRDYLLLFLQAKSISEKIG